MRLDIPDIINRAVSRGLLKAGLEDTPANRIKSLQGIHEEFAENPQFAAGIQNDMLTFIENEVKRLEGLND